jgi:glycosyltransferase involved in cell wall biosynthesis
MNMASESLSKVSALICTIEPIDGGVPTMTRWLCRLLEENNITPELAWYAPWRNYPKLSVPLYRALRDKPGSTKGEAIDNLSSYGFGAWFPEFEFTHYLPRKEWKKIADRHQLHFVVSGNSLAATPYLLLDIPFIAWIATPWEADRKDRIHTFSKPRKILDYMINRPVLKHLEKKILRSNQGKILALSHYTSKELEKISKKSIDDVMLMPVDEHIFTRDTLKTIPWRVGFSGRYCDPRKNIDLLLNATRLIKSQGVDIELLLVGDKDAEQLSGRVSNLDLTEFVTLRGHLKPSDLGALLQTLDVFVIPSHQEGLCIAALEAMSCGVPVISTRCGGPEEYVIPFKTGALVENTPQSLASAIKIICSDRLERKRLSDGCCNWIKENASQEVSRRIFNKHLYDLARKNRIGYLTEADKND